MPSPSSSIIEHPIDYLHDRLIKSIGLSDAMNITLSCVISPNMGGNAIPNNFPLKIFLFDSTNSLNSFFASEVFSSFSPCNAMLILMPQLKQCSWCVWQCSTVWLLFWACCCWSVCHCCRVAGFWNIEVTYIIHSSNEMVLPQRHEGIRVLTFLFSALSEKPQGHAKLFRSNRPFGLAFSSFSSDLIF